MVGGLGYLYFEILLSSIGKEEGSFFFLFHSSLSLQVLSESVILVSPKPRTFSSMHNTTNVNLEQTGWPINLTVKLDVFVYV